jgi:cytochrome c oxidase subunit 1
VTTTVPPTFPPAAPAPRPRVGPLSLLAGTDHKTVALLTICTGIAFFLVAGLFALLMRLELSAPGIQIVGQETYNELFTNHGTAMVFLVVIPLALGLGVYLVPLQLGASNIAAPRLTLAALWLLVLGGLTIFLGFFTTQGAGSAGWTAYPPLSLSPHSPGPGMDMWILGVILATAGAIVFAGTLLATILRLRAPGMTLLRMPVFTWTVLVTCLLTLFAFPVLIAALVMLEVDRRFGGVFSEPGGPLAYQHLFWFFGHPAVYVMFFPFAGAVADIVATFSRKRFFGYRAFVVAILAFSGFSMTVWAHHMFTTGQQSNLYYALTSTSLLIPAGVEYFDYAGTLWRGSIALTTPMLFALGFILQFLVGGITGVALASPALDYHWHDTYFVVAHFHYTLFAGSLFGLFAALYYWFPKVTGRLMRERLGTAHFVLLAIGANVTFFPMFLLGQEGMVRRIADYDADLGFQDMNVLATVGAFVIAAGVIVFLVNVAVSLARPRPAGDDPWDGQTLEWATGSPPPRDNFTRLPPIRSYAPLFDLRRRDLGP